MIGASVLAAGAALGVRHALEADHLAAVATLVDGEADRRGLVGASWGLGHALPIVVLGSAFVVLGVRLPAVVTTLFEAVVGVVLVVLGARLLWGTAVDRVEPTAPHDHGTGLHAHLPVGDYSLGLTHVHLDEESFLVGVVHGFAGSGALVVLLVAAAPSTGAALGFLAGFCALSLVTMAVVSAVWGRAVATGSSRYLEAAVGLLGVGAGAALLAEQAVGFGLV